MSAAIFLVVGLALLLVGGDALVRGAVGLAERMKVPQLIIGLTIVSIGTSAPEMFVSVDAALRDSGGIAIGNVLGSNIANVLLVLGLPSLIAATQCHESGIRRNLIFMLAITVIFMGMMAKGHLARYDGLILLAVLVLFLYEQYSRAAGSRKAAGDNDYHESVGNVPRRGMVIGALLLFGMISLPLGAELTVEGASDLARRAGLSKEVIGLTVIALGTSLPELATSVLAVWRRTHSVAIGNVVGSNIFNIVAIMGVTATIVEVPVAARLVSFDMWVVLCSGILLFAFAHYSVRIGRRLGLAMLALYGMYGVAAFWLN